MRAGLMLASGPDRGNVGFIMVGEGADISISVQPREGFKMDFIDKPGNSPVSFKGAGEIKGGAILHGIEANPGGSVEVTPKVGAGGGELAKYSPTLKALEWGPLYGKKK